MGDVAVADLLSLDRDVGRAFAALEAHRRSLATDPGSVVADDPFEGLRHVAGKSTWDALGALSPSASDVPLRDALRRWVGVFIQARIGLGAENEWAADAVAQRGRLGGDAPRMVSWRDAWRGVALSRSPSEARLWVDAAAQAGPPLATVATTRAIRRVEVAHRMGQSDPWNDLVSVSRGPVRDAALQLLRATEDLAAATRRDAQENEGAASTFFAAGARDASSGWPARLTPAWLLEVFRGEPRDAAPKLGTLPRPAGAASFARALHQFGFGVRLALTQTSLPFAIGHEPAFVAAHLFACLFGALPADPSFHVRALGSGKRTADAEARILTRTLLFEVRLRAARLLLGDDAAFAPAALFPELTVRLFGSPLDERLRGAWPPSREDEPARFIGMLQTGAFRRELRDRFDVDWFHNPRAWGHLRELSAGPAREVVREASDGGGPGPLMTAADDLARELEEALG